MRCLCTPVVWSGGIGVSLYPASLFAFFVFAPPSSDCKPAQIKHMEVPKSVQMLVMCMHSVHGPHFLKMLEPSGTQAGTKADGGQFRTEYTLIPAQASGTKGNQGGTKPQKAQKSI